MRDNPRRAAISFRGNHFTHPTALVAFIQKNSVTWRFRPDQTILVRGEWDTPDARLNAAERILGELARMATAS